MKNPTPTTRTLPARGFKRFISATAICISALCILFSSATLASNTSSTEHKDSCITTCDSDSQSPDNSDHIDKEQIVLDVAGLSLTLNLTPNFVASDSTFEIYGAAQAESSWLRPQTYNGTVAGDPDSWVRVIKNQHGHFLGQVQAFGELYEVSPSSDQSKTTARTLPSMQEQLRSINGTLPLGGSLVDNLVHPPGPKFVANQTQRNAINSLRESFGVEVPKAMRIGIVVDSRFNEYHRGAGLNRAVALINVIDGIYQSELGAALILDTVIAYTDAETDPMRNANGSVEDILESFRTIRELEPKLRSDLTMVHLFTGARDSLGVLGLGWINTACRTDGYDISLSTPFAYDALLAAHEMAHNLGALHDDAPACSTGRSNIMWPRLSSLTEPQFSACSLEAIAPALDASCNLENIDLSVKLQQLNGTGTNRTLNAVVRNNDPARNAAAVSSNFFLPAGSAVSLLPGNCNESIDNTSGSPLITCAHGDIAAQTTQELQLELLVDTSPQAQWAQVRVGSSLTADTTISNNQSQLNLVSGVSNGSPASIQNDTAGAATQLVLPDGSNVPLDQSTVSIASSGNNVSGVSAGGGGTVSPLWLLLLLVNFGFCYLQNRHRFS